MRGGHTDVQYRDDCGQLQRPEDELLARLATSINPTNERRVTRNERGDVRANKRRERNRKKGAQRSPHTHCTATADELRYMHMRGVHSAKIRTYTRGERGNESEQETYYGGEGWTTATRHVTLKMKSSFERPPQVRDTGE